MTLLLILSIPIWIYYNNILYLLIFSFSSFVKSNKLPKVSNIYILTLKSELKSKYYIKTFVITLLSTILLT